MNFGIAQFLRMGPNRDDKGVTTVEYAILLVLVAASVLAVGATLPAKIVSVMSSLATAL